MVVTTPGVEEYVVPDGAAPNIPCNVCNPDVVSKCGPSELPSSIQSNSKTYHDAFFIQVGEVEQTDYATLEKPLFSTGREEPLKNGLDVSTKQKEYLDSKRKVVGEKLCYARPTRSSWPLKQGAMGDLCQLTEHLEHKITPWQREVDLKLMKSVWGGHVRSPKEDDLSEECVCEPPPSCLCCSRPSEMVGQDLRYAYHGLKDPAKDAEPGENDLPACIHHGLSPRKLHLLLEEKDPKNDSPKNYFFWTFAANMTQVPPKKYNFTQFAAYFLLFVY